MIPRPPPDPFLEPCLEFLRAAGPPPGEEALDRLLEGPSDRLHRYLERHRVDQLWYRAVVDLGWEDRLPADLVGGLKQARRMSAVRRLLQLEAARHAGAALAAAGVDHVFIKGIQLGGELYGDGVLRPAADVDLLIAAADREAALAALAAAGFSPDPEEGQPPYQLTLAGHGAALDLHWQLLPPGRSREPLAAPLLAAHRRRGGLWFPDPEGTLVVLLLLPAVSDHVTARLIHAVDLDRWLRRPGAEAGAAELDWRRVFELLAKNGLKTAAWAMLERTRHLFATPVPEGFVRRLAPGRRRRRYLRGWLERDPARLHRHHPLLVRAGFGLLLHDRPDDALRAILGALAGGRSSPAPPSPGGKGAGGRGGLGG